MELYERQILENILEEWKQVEAEELPESVLNLFGGKPELALEENWAVLFFYVEPWGEKMEINLGFGECGGNGKSNFWDGTLHYQFQNFITEDQLQGQIRNGSPLYILNALFGELAEHLEKGN